ncbi:DNA-directed DNA polymerase X [Metarhizium album ARSEF 1941]|uniref:DNA polymerase lambda n=1 Tax=Metarhizium album (strain ARSEF 1941) TaxID=1081103 RepID=A0A0B2X3P8_METAS|nr:DNA-directed DNA polymerase X [Metarhizium album ARSEF 1941]KHN99935.1 DNA-directed DNA polymerase X [Metarhizium album ARSEF 1941]
MASEQPSLDKKLAYFDRLQAWHGHGVADDTFDALEEQDRLVRARFFRARSVPPASTTQAHEDSAAPEANSPRRRVDKIERRGPSKGTTIKATPQSRMRNRLASLLDQDGTTVIPDSTRVERDVAASLGRGRTLDSPLAASRKRTRGSIKLRPEREQIFRGLLFYYVPNNDVAPVRRLRINKAREYGASWTSDVESATHVVVDRGLRYKDVERVVSGLDVTVVSEEYPIDCIRFGAVVDATQRKYMVPGQPEPDEGEGKGEGEGLEESAKSLQIKPRSRSSKRRDSVPTPGTTAADDSPRAELVDGGRAADGARVVSEAWTLGEESGGEAGDVDDELSRCILTMQEFKGLPLDKDDDEDGTSTANGNEARSSDDEDRGSSEDGQRTMGGPDRKRGFGGKHLAFEDRFACNQAGVEDAFRDNPNSRTIEVLQSMASYYDGVGDHWRTTGYRKAITTLKRQATRVATEEEAFRLPHIGRRIAQKVGEIVTTIRLRRLECAQDEPAYGALRVFLQIYGVGAKQAQQWVSQGYRTLEDIKSRAELNPSQRIGVERFDDLKTRIPRREVEALGAVVRRAAARIDAQVELIIGGSYRRGAASSGDIDLMVTKPGTESVAQLRPFLGELVRVLEQDGFLTARLASFRAGGDGSKWHGCCVLPRTAGINGDEDRRGTWRRIDFLLVPASERGAALIYFTGNDIFNRSMRLLASKKGMRLNQRGLYRDATRGAGRHALAAQGSLVKGGDERRIFDVLGVKWREPHERWC